MAVEDYPRELYCNYCGVSIRFDDRVVSKKTGKKYPLDYDTGERHQCQEYRDAVKKAIEEQRRTESMAWKRRLKENQEQSRHERRIRRKGKRRIDEQKTKDSAISVNENSGVERPLIEYRPPDIKEW